MSSDFILNVARLYRSHTAEHISYILYLNLYILNLTLFFHVLTLLQCTAAWCNQCYMLYVYNCVCDK